MKLQLLKNDYKSLVNILFIVVGFNLASAQSNTGWLSPTTNPYNANVTNPTNAYASDGSFATFSSTNDVADYGGFGITIPSGSVITGIEVQIQGRRNDNRELEAVSLSWNNGSSYSNAVPLTTFTGTNAYQNIGSNLWGRAWAVSELSNANFRIRLDATLARADLLIDHVQVKVYYSLPGDLVSLIFNNNGSFTVPNCVTSITVEAWGGGGAGGGVTTANATNDAGGGGGGAYAKKVLNSLSSGDIYTVSPAAQVNGGTGNGSNGNSSIFSKASTNLVVAAGGSGGQSAQNGGAGGLGGTVGNSIGDAGAVFAGGNGSNAKGSPNSYSGYGGGGAGSAGNGKNAVGNSAGTATADFGGAGGAGRSNDGNGSPGLTYGGGGGGAWSSANPFSGGAGAAGQIRITYVVPENLSNNNISYTNGTSGQVNGDVAENASLTLTAPAGTYFSSVNFASYGTPTGTSPNFAINTACHATTSQSVTETYLLGNTGSIAIPATNAVFGDPCVGTGKRLKVLASYAQAICSGTSVTINGTTPTGGTGTFTYLWESSTTSATTGFTAAAGTNNGINYTSAALTQTTWFRRVVTSCSNSSTSAVVMVKVNPKTIPTFTQVASICNGETLAALPTTSINGITGTWSPALNNMATTLYTFTPTTGQCAATVTMTITVGATTTWNGTSWDNGAPTAGIKAIIAENYSANEDITACSLIVNSGKILKIKPTKTLTVGLNLTNNGSIVFESDANGTGRFAAYNGAPITGSGSATVQRYINGKRAFRFLAPSVNTTGTIAANWQQQTHITGSTTGANGFDITTTGNPSLFVYGAPGWSAIANTNVLKLDAKTGYRLLVRGDRTPSLITSATVPSMNTPITLTATGSLVTGDVTYTSLTTTGSANYTLVANPYVSPINWATITKSGIKNAYQVWDPKLGTASQRGRYVSCTTAGATSILDGSGTTNVNQYIQTGQAFFIENVTAGVSGTISIKESDKVANYSSMFRVSNPTVASTATGKLGVSLYESLAYSLGDYPIDAAVAISNENFNTSFDEADVKKLLSSGEQVAFKRADISIGIEEVGTIQSTDELAIATINLIANKEYVWNVVLENNFTTENIYLLDTFTQQYHEVGNDGTTTVTFNTNTGGNAIAVDRFKVVFQKEVLSTPTFGTQIVLYPNPAKSGINSFYLQGITTTAKVSVYNLLGQELPVQTSTYQNGLQVQNINGISTGVYIVNITSEGKTAQVKWIVE